jgi:ABC-type polysaccharide/polyol phosphate transport system ATPase subunit
MDTQSPYAMEIEGLSKRFYRGGNEGILWVSLARMLRRTFTGRCGRDNLFWALQDINLKVRRGEAVGIIGPNGAGKSTLLKILSRVLRPTHGHMQINGRLSGLIEVGAGFHADLSGRENIYINGAILGMGHREIKCKFDRIVEFAGIRDFLDMPVKRYSSGMFVRLGFSIAAHMEPDILLVDEVLSVGDVQFKAKCMDAMRNFLRKGTSIIFVSHNLASIKRFCDRAMLIDHGRIQYEGTPDNTISEYSRLVSDLEDANPQGIENSHIGGCTNNNGPVSIKSVRILDGDGRPANRLVSGQPARLEVDYDIDPASGGLTDPNLVVAAHMFGAGLFFRFDTLRDGVKLGHCIGQGTVTIDLPQLHIGEGVFQISVAFADEKGLPQHDWHDRAYRIHVEADGQTDGPVHQPRKWQIINHRQLNETAPSLKPSEPVGV